MSRSNGSQPQPTGHAPQASGYEFSPDARAWTAPQSQAAQRPAAQQQPAPQQGYAQPQGYADPYAQHGGYYQQPAQAPAPSYAAPQAAVRSQLNSGSNYTPQFDPYVPSQNPTHNPAHSVAQTYQPATPAYPDLRGSTYDQWAGHQQAQPDPRAYDLANYGNQQTQVSVQSAAQAARAPAEWAHQQQSGQYAQQAYDPYQQAGQQMQPAGQDYGLHADQHDQAQGAAYGETYAAEDTEAPMDVEEPHGRRGFMIAATLAGAIFVGGGLTYAYNSLLGPGTGGPPPLVKSAAGPSKVKPAEPGGKQFDHADSKVLGRLSEGDAAAEADASGAKKVATLVVKPDGSIQPPAVAEPAPAAAPTAATPANDPAPAHVPGMSVVSVGDTPVPGAAVPAGAAAQKVVAGAKQAVEAVAAAAPKTPVVISSAAPAAAPAAPAAAKPAASSLVETAAVDPAAAVVPAAKKVAAPVVKKAAAAATAAVPAAAAPAAAAGAGYMAVVASVPASAKSRMDALTRWADMQQKYGSILQSKTMDVQEANLGEKGTYHRLLVGPPSSRDSANSICSQLKAAGHTDCWVMGN